jgi:hypothetical protein
MQYLADCIILGMIILLALKFTMFDVTPYYSLMVGLLYVTFTVLAGLAVGGVGALEVFAVALIFELRGIR